MELKFEHALNWAKHWLSSNRTFMELKLGL